MDDYVEVHAGKYCTIWISPKAIREIKKATAGDRARTKRYLIEFAENGQENLNEQQVKNEGRYPSGGKNSRLVQVFAFKGAQLRIYCGTVEKNGKQLLCVEATKKKQNKANLAQLQRIAKKVGKIQNGTE